MHVLQISFNKSLFDLPFETVMKDYSNTIQPGIMLGKENGLTLMLDAEVYDYAFSPQRGEGFKEGETDSTDLLGYSDSGYSDCIRLPG